MDWKNPDVPNPILMKKPSSEWQSSRFKQSDQPNPQYTLVTSIISLELVSKGERKMLPYIIDSLLELFWLIVSVGSVWSLGPSHMDQVHHGTLSYRQKEGFVLSRMQRVRKEQRPALPFKATPLRRFFIQSPALKVLKPSQNNCICQAPSICPGSGFMGPLVVTCNKQLGSRVETEEHFLRYFYLQRMGKMVANNQVKNEWPEYFAGQC